MAYVICVVGAGGKTSYIRHEADRFLAEGKTVLISTTTHIWRPCGEDLVCREISISGGLSRDTSGGKIIIGCGRSRDTSGEKISISGGLSGQEEDPSDRKGEALSWISSSGGPDYAGTDCGDAKIRALPGPVFAELCKLYDVVLVEGDGSRHMPVKIPREDEPVIPPNCDEIVVIMGPQAVGREIRAVCHRYDPERLKKVGLKTGTDAVSEKLLKNIAEEFYIRPLENQFPGIPVSFRPGGIYRTGYLADTERITLVLMASGFSRRYGGNKLLEIREGKALYMHALDHLIEALEENDDSKGGEIVPSLKLPRTEILVVTRYGEICEQVSLKAEGLKKEGSDILLKSVWNDEAQEGISASIRIGAYEAWQKGSGAAAFFAADMPYLPGAEIRRFLLQFLSSGKSCACMEIIPEHELTNPGAFRLNENSMKELMCHRGDKGAMMIMRRHPQELYHYQIAAEYVRDIDRRE